MAVFLGRQAARTKRCNLTGQWDLGGAASRMGRYPVHLHRLPSNASSISSSEGSGGVPESVERIEEDGRIFEKCWRSSAETECKCWNCGGMLVCAHRRTGRVASRLTTYLDEENMMRKGKAL